MTTVYLVRHAEAEGNLYRRVHGWYNSLITDNGYRQIAALRGRFADIHIDAVYSSDLFRTMTTAKAVYLSHGLELHTDPGLREISLGAWEDKPWGELERCDAMNLIRFNHSSPDFRVEGGETFAQVQARLKGTVLRLAAAHPGQTIALFSHGTAIRCLQAALRGLGPGEMDGLGHSDNTAVTCLEVEGDTRQGVGIQPVHQAVAAQKRLHPDRSGIFFGHGSDDGGVFAVGASADDFKGFFCRNPFHNHDEFAFVGNVEGIKPQKLTG